MDLLQPMMVAALLAGGMGVAILGSVKVPLAQRLGIDEARVGGLVSIFGFVMIPAILTAGLLTDLVGRHAAGKQAVLAIGSALLAVSLVLLAQARAYRGALLAVLLMGAAWALLINIGNVLTPMAFSGRGMAFATNLANVFFGLGAFLTPLVVAVLIARASLSAALYVLGAFALLPALLAFGVRFPASPDVLDMDLGRELVALLGDPVLWLCGLALFFYGPLEASIAAWTTTYAGEQGVSQARAPAVLSAFWLCFMGARLVTALVNPSGWEEVLILGLALACVAVLLAMVLCRGPGPAVALVIAAGIIFGPLFPTILAVLLAHFDKSLHGRAVGLFFAIGGVGWTTIPLLIGAYASRAGLRRGLSVAAAAAGGLSLVALALLLRA